ncbi:MAG TPA: hypothetical protein PKG71_03520 [Candidatus Woesebacteria bacterium]|nr:hypothetical protein [Candidatus Woesebacteria bacterium]
MEIRKNHISMIQKICSFVKEHGYFIFSDLDTVAQSFRILD